MNRRALRIGLLAGTCAALGVAGLAGWRVLRPHDALGEARRYEAAGQFRAAELVLRGALRADPRANAAALALARVQLRLGEPVAAERALRDALAGGAAAEAVMPVLARAVSAQGRAAEVLRDFPPQGLPDAAQATVLVARAEAELRLGRPDAAAQSLDAARRLAPGSTEAVVASGRLALHRGDKAAAEAAAAAALAIDPHAADAQLLRAELRAASGDRAAALAGYAAVLAEPSASPQTQLAARLARAAALAASGQDAAAETDLAAVRALAPAHPGALLLAARLAARAGDWKAAEAALLRTGPALASLPDGELTLALVKDRLGQPEQALQAAERQLSQNPRDLTAARLATSLALAQHRPAQAALHAERLAALLAASDATEGEGAGGWALVRAADAAAGRPGDTAERALREGTEKLAQIDLAGAQADFAEAVRVEPDSVPAQVSLARVQALQGMPDAAVARLQAVLATRPAAPAAVAALVSLRLQAGDSDGAVVVAEQAVRAAPADRGLLAGLMALRLRLDQPQAALQALDGVADADSDPALLALRWQAQQAAGQSEAAIGSLRRLLQGAPDAVAVRVALAEALAGTDPAAAQALLRDGLGRAGLRRGDDSRALLAGLVGVAGRAGGPAAALAEAQRLAADPAWPEAAVLPGELLLRQGKAAEAAANYAGLLPRLADPAAASGIAARLAEARAASGAAPAAAAQLRDWVAAHPEQDAAVLVLASLDLQAGRLAEARQGLEAVLRRAPDTASVLNNLAWIRQRQGDLEAAETLARRAYRLGPGPQTADTLGWILAARLRFAPAVVLLREAAAADPQDKAVQYHLAAALAGGGETAAAVARLRVALDDTEADFTERPDAARLLAELAP